MASCTWDNDRLRDLFTFLEGLRNAGRAAFSSKITVCDNPDSRKFVCLVEVGEPGASGPCTQLVDPACAPGVVKAPLRLSFVTEASTLAFFRTLVAVAGPAWKHAILVFFWNPERVSAWMDEVYSLLRSCPNLSTIRLLCRGYRYLPTLVCGNPSLESLILDYTEPLDSLEDAETLALCFSENSVLKSLTLRATFTTLHMWKVALKPFTEGRVNAAVKELVLAPRFGRWDNEIWDRVIYAKSRISGSVDIQATANLVRANTTIEKLILCFEDADSLAAFPSIPKALAFNRTLNEFHWDRATVAGLKELRAAFAPDSSGNSHVTTLKLCPFHDLKLSMFMKELSKLLKRNTSLKHVEVGMAHFNQRAKPWTYCEVRSSNVPPHVATECTQDIVESMVSKELRVNTSLESVVVGSWKLLRVDGHGEWQMKYCGPCLLRRSALAQENRVHFKNYAQLCYVVSYYDIKVQMQQ